MPREKRAVEAVLLALPQTAGSALYGMVDVLAATGIGSALAALSLWLVPGVSLFA